jgi:hypothetical protein
MNVKSIYAAPSNLDRAFAALNSVSREFNNGMWIPFAAFWLMGIVALFAGFAQESLATADLYQIGGQAALDGYFATVHAAHLTVLQMMSDALLGHSVRIGGVLQGWGYFISLAIVPAALVLSLSGATISAYVDLGRGYRRY